MWIFIKVKPAVRTVAAKVNSRGMLKEFPAAPPVSRNEDSEIAMMMVTMAPMPKALRPTMKIRDAMSVSVEGPWVSGGALPYFATTRIVRRSSSGSRLSSSTCVGRPVSASNARATSAARPSSP